MKSKKSRSKSKVSKSKAGAKKGSRRVVSAPAKPPKPPKSASAATNAPSKRSSQVRNVVLEVEDEDALVEVERNV